MKTITTFSDLHINQDSRVLFFMPHPDDEAVFVSGLIKKLTRSSIPVKVVTLTQGESSTLRYGLKPKADLAQVRRGELVKSFKILGLTSFSILTFPDGGLKNQLPKVKATIHNEIKQLNPSLVITLEPDGIYGHPDHITLSLAVTQVVKPPVRLLYATIAEFHSPPNASSMAEKSSISPLAPQFRLKLSIVEKLAKIRSLQSHHSQFKVSKTNSKDFNFFQKNRLLSYEFFAFSR
jgi:LmbE family N-acetylglucosaminyl deacetylase